MRQPFCITLLLLLAGNCLRAELHPVARLKEIDKWFASNGILSRQGIREIHVTMRDLPYENYFLDTAGRIVKMDHCESSIRIFFTWTYDSTALPLSATCEYYSPGYAERTRWEFDSIGRAKQVIYVDSTGNVLKKVEMVYDDCRSAATFTEYSSGLLYAKWVETLDCLGNYGKLVYRGDSIVSKTFMVPYIDVSVWQYLLFPEELKPIHSYDKNRKRLFSSKTVVRTYVQDSRDNTPDRKLVAKGVKNGRGQWLKLREFHVVSEVGKVEPKSSYRYDKSGLPLKARHRFVRPLHYRKEKISFGFSYVLAQ